MATLAFAAEVLYGAGERKPAGLVPERVPSPQAAIVVRNPFTNRTLTLRAQDVVNIVNGVAAVRITANTSRRFPTYSPKRGLREYINPLTGNTFQVNARAIIKENA